MSQSEIADALNELRKAFNVKIMIATEIPMTNGKKFEIPKNSFDVIFIDHISIINQKQNVKDVKS